MSLATIVQAPADIIDRTAQLDPIVSELLTWDLALKAVENAKNKSFFLHVATALEKPEESMYAAPLARAVIAVTKRTAISFLNDIKSSMAKYPNHRIDISQSKRCVFIGCTPLR